MIGYVVSHKESGQQYALKTLEKKKLKETNKIECIMNERNIYETISHPYIIDCHCAFQNVRISDFE